MNGEAQSRPTQGVFSRGRRMLTIGIVLSVTLAGFEALGVSAAMPRVASDLGGRRLYGIAIGAFMLGQLATIPVAGAMADRNRPRLAYALGLGAFAMGLVLAAVAPSMVVVVIARTVAGLGAGALTAVNFATIGRAYPEAIRSRMFAVVSSAWVIPGAIGPAAAGWVADHLGWRWVFAGLIPLFPIISAFVLRALRDLEPSPVEAPTANVVATALQLSLGAGIVIAGLGAPSAIFALALVAIGAVITLPALRTLLPTGTLTLRRGLPSIVAAVSLVFTTFVAAEAFIPRVLIDVRRRSSSVAALALTGGTLMWTAGSWLQARSPKWWADRRRFAYAVSALGCGIACVLGALWSSVPLAVPYLGWTAGGIGMGLAFTLMSEASLRLADPTMLGRVAAATQLAPSLGIAVLTAAEGRVAGSGGVAGLRMST